VAKIRYEEMLPGELEKAIREKPLAWIPVGTLEWHGRHLPVGLDALKAHALCLRIAERAGGVVLPPNYISMGGMHFPWTFRHSPAAVMRILFSTMEQLYRNGFKVMFIVSGHYPQTQIAAFIAAAHAFMLARDAVVVAAPEFFFASETGYFGDHAARWETSLLMELRPELVDQKELSHLTGEDLFSLFRGGVMGENPAHTASRELGAAACDEIVNNASQLAERLLDHPDKDIARRFHRDAVVRFFEFHVKNVVDNIRVLF
jgi:creatinine amidohydrolase